jgi:hypothetical protein
LPLRILFLDKRGSWEARYIWELGKDVIGSGKGWHESLVLTRLTRLGRWHSREPRVRLKEMVGERTELRPFQDFAPSEPINGEPIHLPLNAP